MARVISVVPDGEVATYDLEVEGNHNFVVEGALVHNCHRVAADSFSLSGFRVPAKLRLGLSATPDRRDGKLEVIHAHIGVVRVRSSAAPMRPRVVARQSPWKVPLTRVKNPTTGNSEVGQVPHSAGKCGHVINMITRHHERNLLLCNFAATAYKSGRNVLVQSDRKEHLETLHMILQTMGVPLPDMGFYLGGMKEAELDKLEGRRLLLATFQMTSEGTDIPWMDTLVMGTPKSDVRQIVGRVLRAVDGKKEPLVFDLIDSSSKVFSAYWKARKEWYQSIGAEVSERGS